MAFLNFDATTIEPSGGNYEVLPAGSYQAEIIESEVVPTKTGTGQRLKLTWKITSGQFVNRLVFDSLNIQNQSQKAEEIGQRQLSALCHAAGVLRLRDTNELHGIPIVIRVSIKKDETGQYDDQNEVKGYASAPNGQQRQQAQAAPVAPTRPATQAIPPWASRG